MPNLTHIYPNVHNSNNLETIVKLLKPYYKESLYLLPRGTSIASMGSTVIIPPNAAILSPDRSTISSPLSRRSLGLDNSHSALSQTKAETQDSVLILEDAFIIEIQPQGNLDLISTPCVELANPAGAHLHPEDTSVELVQDSLDNRCERQASAELVQDEDPDVSVELISSIPAMESSPNDYVHKRKHRISELEMEWRSGKKFCAINRAL